MRVHQRGRMMPTFRKVVRSEAIHRVKSTGTTLGQKMRGGGDVGESLRDSLRLGPQPLTNRAAFAAFGDRRWPVRDVDDVDVGTRLRWSGLMIPFSDSPLAMFVRGVAKKPRQRVIRGRGVSEILTLALRQTANSSQGHENSYCHTFDSGDNSARQLNAFPKHGS